MQALHTVLLVCCCQGALAGGGAPDPYPQLNGGRFGPAPPASPDPLAGYVWANLSALADRYQYQLYYDAPVHCDPPDAHECNDGSLTVRANGTTRFKFIAESAGWIEIDSAELREAMRAHGVTVGMSVSESRLPAPSESGQLTQYNGTFRLELNKQLYEGVRYAWLTVGGMKQGTPAWHISAVRRVNQALPANYEGAFSSSDAFLDRLWYVGAYTTRATFVSTGKQAYLGSILMNRGDRIAFLGDAHVAQATALAAFGSSVYELLANSNVFCSTVGNNIEPYWLMWVLSILDYNDATNDTAAFGTMIPLIEKWLGRARDSVYPLTLNSSAPLRWSRDDERMGFGFEFPDVPNAQCAYRGLMTECAKRFGSALAAAGNASGGESWSRLGERYTQDFGNGTWWHSCGMHGTADAVNAGVVSKGSPIAEAIRARWFADPVQLASLSPFESFFVLRALIKLGLDDEALYLVHRQWGGMIAAGATMTWERFDPAFADAGAIRGGDSDDPPVNSMNDRTSMAHPWSSAATALLSRFALGVEATSAGFATWRASPRFMSSGGCGETPHRLKWVSGRVPTPHGPVQITVHTDRVPARQPRSSAYIIRSSMAVTVPERTVGTVALPVPKCSTGMLYEARLYQTRWAVTKAFDAAKLCHATEDDSNSGLLHAWSGRVAASGVETQELRAGHYLVCSGVDAASNLTSGAPSPSWDAHKPNFTYPVTYHGSDRNTNGAWIGRYGSAGYHFFNYSKDLDLSKLPTFVRAVWASCKEDTQGGAPYTGRVACRPDGPFAESLPTRPYSAGAPSGRMFGSCAFVGLTPNASDARVLEPPSDLGPVDVSVSAISAIGWKGSFHVDVKLTDVAESAGTPFNISLYFADYNHWQARQVVKVTDLLTQRTVAETVLVEDFHTKGLYLTYRAGASLRFRVHQVHSAKGDRQGWAPPPLLTAVFFD